MTDYKIEEDKELIWIDPYECTKYLSLEHQSWAVLKAIEYKFLVRNILIDSFNRLIPIHLKW